jgi:hypothetical protein
MLEFLNSPPGEPMASAQPHPGLYLIVDFDWPAPVTSETADKARHLHTVLQGQLWIREVVAASGGVGGGPRSTWVFWLENYSALDRLLHDPSDEISKAYDNFFSAMPLVVDKVRDQVLFSK